MTISAFNIRNGRFLCDVQSGGKYTETKLFATNEDSVLRSSYRVRFRRGILLFVAAYPGQWRHPIEHSVFLHTKGRVLGFPRFVPTRYTSRRERGFSGFRGPPDTYPNIASGYQIHAVKRSAANQQRKGSGLYEEVDQRSSGSNQVTIKSFQEMFRRISMDDAIDNEQ